MLAIFCLRLALGMLIALAFLSPSKMHPRFFRTHFLVALGLSVVALIAGSSYTGPGLYESSAASIWPNKEPPTLQPAFLVTAVACTCIGAIVWGFARPFG